MTFLEKLKRAWKQCKFLIIRVRYDWVRQILETYQQFYDVIFHVVCIYLQHRYDTVFDVINNPIFAFAFNFDEGLEKICTKEALEVAKKQFLN